MKFHTFVPVDKDFRPLTKVWMVYCTKSGGSFSTEIWRTGKIAKDKCPCCGEVASE